MRKNTAPPPYSHDHAYEDRDVCEALTLFGKVAADGNLPRPAERQG
jgi:hypothetical protein